MDWYLLGIEPTKDKKAITNAYRTKLQHTNPEEKPEEFKALRAAYEEALRFAAQPDEAEVQDESPVGRWIARVQNVYQDYPARINPASWEKLLSDPVCTGLDTRPAAEQALLQFLMEHYFLPRNVWIRLDELLSLQKRQEELYELCPREFVDLVILNGIRFHESLPYELFIPGKDSDACDAYRKLFYQINQMPPEQADEPLTQLEAMPEQHPYGQTLRCRQQIAAGNRAQALQTLEALANAYPEDHTLTMLWADFCLEEGRGAEAEAIANAILSQNPDHKQAKRLHAECLALQERYEEAKELIYELLHAAGGDPIQTKHLTSYLNGWNEKLILRLQAMLEQEPDHAEHAIELAWCYMQNERIAEAEEIALRIDPAKADPYQYHNLLGKLRLNAQDFAGAHPHFQAAVDILRQLPESEDAETEKKRRRLPEFLQLLGNCLYQLGSQDDAMLYFEEALSLAPDNPEILTIMGRMLYSCGNFTRAAEILEHLTRIAPESSHGHVLLSLVLYRLHRDRDAFDAVNRSLALMTVDLSSYILKMQILLRNGVFEEVRDILDYLTEHGAPDSPSVDFIRAQLTELEEKDTAKALTHYRALADSIEKGESEGLLFPAQLYFRMAVLMGSEGSTAINELIAMLDKGLAEDEHDEDCLSYKAWLLSRSDRTGEAIALYRDMLATGRASASVEYGLAELYSNHLNRYADEALAYYMELLEKQQTPELCFYTATCLRQMGDYDGARRYYEKELELNPEDVDGYNGLAYICDALGQNEQSLEYINQALEAMERAQQVYPWLIEHQIQILRRMGKAEAALAALEDAVTRWGHENAHQLRFDICCQFGLWEQARQALAQWKLTEAAAPARMKAEGRYHLLRGEMFKAAIAMGKAKHKLPFEDVQDFRLQLADLECNYRRMHQIRSRRAKEDPENDYFLMNLAETCWRMGDKAGAAAAAEKALSILDEILQQHLTDEALYRSRRSLLLAILGREEEARAELVRTRSLPLCDFCEYGSCKDADVFEAQIEEICGNRNRAKELYGKGKEKWPDELDFSAGLARMKKKGR